MAPYRFEASLRQTLLLMELTKDAVDDLERPYQERIDAAEMYHQLNRKLGYPEEEAARRVRP